MSREQWLQLESETLSARVETEGEAAARVLKRKLMSLSDGWDPRIPLHRISAKSFYESHQQVLDTFANFFNKHNLDVQTFVDFFVDEMHCREKHIDKWLFSKRMMEKYVDYLKRRSHLRQIYSWFMKSAENLADEAITQGYVLGKDVLRSLFAKKKISNWVVSGKMSLYFLAAIPNFKNVIPKLDYFSRLELEKFADRIDIFKTDVNEAFLVVKNIKLNPMAVVDELIAKKRARHK